MYFEYRCNEDEPSDPLPKMTGGLSVKEEEIMKVVTTKQFLHFKKTDHMHLKRET